MEAKSVVSLFVLLLLPSGQLIRGAAQEEDTIYPERLDSHRNKRDLSTDNSDGVHEDAASFRIKAFQKNFILDTKKNKILAGPSITVRYFDDDDNEVITQHTPEHCHFQGSIRGIKNSAVALSTCHGTLKGFIDDGHDSYQIEPLHDDEKPGAHKIFPTNNEEHSDLKCGNDHHHTHGDQDTAARVLKERRYHGIVQPDIPVDDDTTYARDEPDNKRLYLRVTDADPAYIPYLTTNETRYVEMMYVVDNAVYQKYKNQTKAVVERVMELSNAVDKIYQPINMRVVMKGLEIWTNGDRVPYKPMSLSAIKNYRNKELMPKINHDHLAFLSSVSWPGAYGWAYVNTMCGSLSVSVNYLYTTHVVVAHELGHSLGFPHVGGDDNCTCLTARGCIMRAWHRWIRFPGFYDCDLRRLKRDWCLFNVPTQGVTVTCGNGIREGDEECDCGTPEKCRLKDPCCIPHTCKLRAYAQCSDLHHTCCKNCLVKRQGILCRGVKNTCDVPEYCTGASRDCPADSFVQNGHPCANSHCYMGKCADTSSAQCQELWGRDANNAHKGCYDTLNTGSTGYQGYGTCNPATNTSCSLADVLCGQIQCSASRDTPVVKYGQSYKKITLATGECSAAVLGHSDVLGEGMVKEGTKCGDGKMCMDNKCKPLSDINTVSCPVVNGHTCAGRGVCVNTGVCHCHAGYDPKTGCDKPLPVVNGGYSEWSVWTRCTRVCGGGRRRRHRLCNNPFPSNGGKVCTGEALQQEDCNIDACPVAYSCRHLQTLLKAKCKGVRDGVYKIYPNGPAQPITTYCDMSRDGGGWTLLVTSVTNTWTSESVMLKNADSPSLDADFSILKYADSIKDNIYVFGSTYNYRLEAEHIGHWGGIFEGKRSTSFASRSGGNTDVTLVKAFDNWQLGSSSIQKQMPWVSGATLTTSDSGNGWGTIASDNKGYYPAAWIKNVQRHPFYIWYWMREGPYIPPRSCQDVQSRYYEEFSTTRKPLSSGVFTIKPTPKCEVKTYCDMTSQGGGWTLVATSKTHVGWTLDNVKHRNTDSPGLDGDYSILGCADAIKDFDKSQDFFQYRIEADGSNTFGGLWKAPRQYSFTSNNAQTGITLVKSFNQINPTSNLAKCMPRLGLSSNILLTSASSLSDASGSLIYNVNAGQSPSYLPSRPQPTVVRYWMRETVRPLSQWPAGEYGLPKPLSGCPLAYGFVWQAAFRFQDTEDSNPGNYKSGSFHLDAVVGKDVKRSFCVKTYVRHDGMKGAWPKGEYCVYRKGSTCPGGFTSGWVRWDDENSGNRNLVQGAVPDGVYTNETLIYFCCRKDGGKAEPIFLPTYKAFYLLAHGSSVCQQVKFAMATTEFIRFDTEDSNNKNSQGGMYPYGAGISDHKIHYCYYASCNHTLAENNGTVNSPNYPQSYPNGQLCSWRITVQPGLKVVLDFVTFALHSTDSVQVFNGIDETSGSIGMYPGLSKPTRVVSSLNEMLIIFKSDATQTGKGFVATYQAMDLLAVNGEYSEWTAWTDCPKSCGGGKRIRHRLCNNPSPSNGGKDCNGERQQEKDCNTHACPVSHIFWPAGEYGIPKPLSGCPLAYGFVWQTGVRYQDLEDSGSNNYKSPSFHLDAVVGGNVKRSFCVKTDVRHDSVRGTWPKGEYCVYRKNNTCPHGFTSGWVRWDDENNGNGNSIQGIIPDGDYTKDTVIYFCCKQDGSKADPISLPTNKPFYLLAHGSPVCQQVNFAVATTEFLRFDTEDTNNNNSQGGVYPYGAGISDHKIHYCYYTSCNYTLTGNGTVRTPNYPKLYPNGQLCTWRITVQPGLKAVLDFVTFALQNGSSADVVQVYDGRDETSASIGRYSGIVKPSRIVSPSNEMFIMFKSDAATAGEGFLANYQGLPLTSVHGGFGAWSNWTSCTKSCGGGTRSQNRLCNNPVPSNGGKDCSGERVQTEECNTHLCPVSHIFWPAGEYGLPKPLSGCPLAYGFVWQTGVRYQDLEDSASNNYKSPSFHLDAVVGGNVKRSFCVKTDVKHDSVRGTWPKGEYCVYRKGDTCPGGFTSGWVRWDDENNGNGNSIQGTIPDGVYTKDTVIYFCCKKDGRKADPINLPTKKPFYLLAHGSPVCQQVNFAVATTEFLRFDTEDTNNTDSQGGVYPYGAGISDHKIHYCYYTSCNYTLTGNGTVSTPNYPKPYPNGQLCTWRITVQPGLKVVLDFVTFALQNGSSADVVQVYNGKDETSASIGKYSGIVKPSRIVSPSNEMFIMFKSDESTAGEGFLANYQGLDLIAVNGGYSEWSAWTDCHKSCGGGKRIRHRLCNNPSPSNGGKDCVGERQQEKDCNTHACPVSHIFWPAGEYGIPKPLSGCPLAYGFVWQTGVRYQDLEDSGSNNYKSPSFHLDAVVGGNVKRSFCVKTDVKHDSVRGTWPKGEYCVYRKGDTCPGGFTSGWVRWDDENNGNGNYIQGTIPDGVYTRDTVIYFCCKKDGRKADSISLPTNKPFYLLAHGSPVCQQVNFAIATTEFLRFDTEDTNNNNSQGGVYPYGAGISDHKIHYCYYTSCNYTLTGNGTVRTPNYPKHYPNGQLCSWRITVQPGLKVVLDFVTFALQNGSSADVVQVYDGKDETSASIGRYSGIVKPSRIVSPSNEMFIMFKSDAATAGEGFLANYQGLRTHTSASNTTEDAGVV